MDEYDDEDEMNGLIADDDADEEEEDDLVRQQTSYDLQRCILHYQTFYSQWIWTRTSF